MAALDPFSRTRGGLIAVALVVLEDRLRQDPSVLRQHGLERADFSAGMLNREGT